MSVQKFLLEAVAHTIADGAQWSAMKTLVSDIESADMTGSEKKAKVIADFEAIGYKLAGWIVDTLLQLAVMYIKTVIV